MIDVRGHRQIFRQDSCRLSNRYYFDAQGDVVVRPGTKGVAIDGVALRP